MKCDNCSEEFEVKYENHPSRFCSPRCRTRYWAREHRTGNAPIFHCEKCGKESWGKRCRKCWLDTKGLPVSKLKKKEQ